MAYFARDEVAPQEDSCEAELALHAHLSAEPFAAVREEELDAIIKAGEAEVEFDENGKPKDGFSKPYANIPRNNLSFIFKSSNEYSNILSPIYI